METLLLWICSARTSKLISLPPPSSPATEPNSLLVESKVDSLGLPVD